MIDLDAPHEVTEIATILAPETPTFNDADESAENLTGFSDIVSFFEEAARANEETSEAPQLVKEEIAPQVTEVASLPAANDVEHDGRDPLGDFFGEVISFLESAQPIETPNTEIQVAYAAPTIETAALMVEENNVHQSNPLVDIFDFLDNAHQASLEDEAKAPLKKIDPVRFEIDQTTADENKENATQVNAFAFLNDLFSSVKSDVSKASYEPLSAVSFEEFDGN